MDYRSGMGAARDEGIAIGYDQARLEYEAKLAKAERTRREHEQMLAKADQDKLEIARKMKARGWSVAEIAEDTGLSPETIAKL